MNFCCVCQHYTYSGDMDICTLKDIEIDEFDTGCEQFKESVNNDANLR